MRPEYEVIVLLYLSVRFSGSGINLNRSIVTNLAHFLTFTEPLPGQP